jgi:hypothetical protein
MANVGLIKVLRHCGSHKGCYNCPLGKAAGDCMKILIYAADALEAAEKRIAELEKRTTERNTADG